MRRDLTILVTGAEGFVGKHLAGLLSREGYPVVGTRHATRFESSESGVALELCDAAHMTRLAEALPGISTVVHLAGKIEISLRPDPQDARGEPLPGNEHLETLYRANVAATANVLEFCVRNGVRHLVFASSQAVYGLPETAEVTEDTPLNPLEHYAASKVACEAMLRVGARQGLAVTVLRIPGLYAESRRSGAVYRFCRAARTDGRIEVGASYPLPFDVLHLDDAVEGIVSCVRHGGEGYGCVNVSTGEDCSLDILADAVAALVPGCVVRHAAVAQPRIRLSAERARKLFGWQAAPRSVRLQAMLASLQGNSA